MSENAQQWMSPGALTLEAIAALTVPPDRYPSPIEVARYLGIPRQVLHARLRTLERAGAIERRNHGHAIKLLGDSAVNGR